MIERDDSGTTDGVERLRLRLPNAPPPYLAAALDNPATGKDEVVLLLRNRQAQAAVLRRIGARPDWTASRDVRALLALHANAPLPLARRFLPHLTWVELAAAARDPRVSPAIRRDAERLLIVRLPELAVGERISLARQAPRRVTAVLRTDGDAAVLRALLENPRASEADAMALADSAATPAPVLDHLSRDSRWGLRPSVRRRLLRNRSTPAPAALRLVARLPRAELPALSTDEEAPGFVRIAARRRLEGSFGRPAGEAG